MNIKAFDLHCDTALELLGQDLRPIHALRKNGGHIDLSRGAALEGYAQCFALFTTPDMEKWMGRPATAVFDAMLENLTRELEYNGDLICQARTPRQIRDNQKAGKLSAVLTIEGPAGFGFDPARLEELWNRGFRITTLTWNEKNPLAGSHVTGGGLTDQGREYIREAQRLGMVIDVSHISDEAFWDIMKVTEKPVIASHSNSRAVCGVSRNLTDDMFRAISETGGTVGQNLYTQFLGEKDVTVDTVCDHIFHFLEMDPQGSHISLGGDLDGCETLPAGFGGIQNYPDLADRLRSRGLSTELVEKIFWENALGVLERCQG